MNITPKRYPGALVSGYFDPIMPGHLKFLRSAAEFVADSPDLSSLGVILNTDEQAALKKGSCFQPLHIRSAILEELPFIDDVFVSIDIDHTVRETLRFLHPLAFLNSGDRDNHNIPEADICEICNISLYDGFDADDNHSSDYTHRVPVSWTVTPWGKWRDLEYRPGLRVKELHIEPGHSTSLQYHSHRAESLTVITGDLAYTSQETFFARDTRSTKIYLPHQTVTNIPLQIHQLTNPTASTLVLIEVQTGDPYEADIIRISDPYYR